MELRDYIRALRRHWIVIALLTVVGAGFGAGYALVVTPVYEARTKVFVAATGASTVQELNAGSSFTQQIVRSYAEVVKTGIVLDPVIKKFDLGITPAELAKNVTATVKVDTVIVDITVTDPDPFRAARIANAIADNLIAAAPELTPTTAAGSDPVKITVTQEAEVPLEPVSPQLILSILIGAVLGLAVAVMVAALHTLLDQRIRGVRDVQLITDHPVLGAITFDPRMNERPLIVHEDPLSPRSESFRSLRTNLQFIGMDGNHRSFVMTSSLELEGKSTTTANLAITLRDSGMKVCVIEGDLRRPKIAQYLGLEGAVGLSDVLIGRVPLTDALQTWGGGNMSVLPAGRIPPNPSELLGSAAMARVLKELEAEFHVVLIDAPPLLPVTDAALLSKLASGAIVLVAAGRTHRGQLDAALRSLAGVEAKIHGIVLTMMPTKGADSYSYGYGYGVYASGYLPAIRS